MKARTSFGLWAITGRRSLSHAYTRATVIRKAFRMQVNPGMAAEYAQRHQPIWKELEDTLLAHGVRTYSIYLDPHRLDLFGYVEFESEAAWNAVAQTDVCRRWWRFMRDIMPANPDDSPVSRELREIFHIEAT